MVEEEPQGDVSNLVSREAASATEHAGYSARVTVIVVLVQPPAAGIEAFG